ncbi:hypothetical protein [Robertmurraya sp. FSL R5-0851]|uniref:hypothetical protein n=1 Tax=Robertmurraya sp. FSL R5-0851 TaxID=2921584 RepID=UPI0030F77100
MNIFQIKTKPHDKERLNEFVQGKFIAIGWPGIGDLAGVEKEEIRQRLEQRYTYKNARSLGNDLGNVWAFVNTMQEGDLVLFNGHQDYVYIVKVGPYRYEEQYDNEEGMAHQRAFELIKVAKRDDLNPKIQELLRNRSAVTKFKYPLEDAELDEIPANEILNFNSKITVDKAAIEKALNILYLELESNDSDRRFKAAIELLQFAK